MADKYGKWYVGQMLRPIARPKVPPLSDELADHVEFAADFLQRQSLVISGTMRKHQLKLADRQCRISDVSQRIQDAMTILCTALYAGRRHDEAITAAADVLCRRLQRQLTGRRASDGDFRAATRLGETVADGGFEALAGVDATEIMMSYENR